MVTGSYHDWGYTSLDPTYAGSISGTVCGSALSGAFWSTVDGGASTLSWSLLGGELRGTFVTPGGTERVWCGVPTGISLPKGCGWSDDFNALFDGDITLTQTADEVIGVSNPTQNPFDGVVSDSRVNGRYGASRFSFWMSDDGNTFTGNEFSEDNNPVYQQWCGARISSSGIEPPAGPGCVGGGGVYDGTWFTNLGTITLTQPLSNGTPADPSPSNTVTGVWFFWGSDVEYRISGTVAGGLSWTDNSILGGGVGLAMETLDIAGHTLTGFAVNGGLWCGVNYGQDPNAFDADEIGNLFLGCGLTDEWQFFQVPSPGLLAANQDVTQRRGSIVSGRGPVTIQGALAQNPLAGPSGPWVVVSGTWKDSSGSGTFNWYPDLADQTFAGDFSSATADGGWCGSIDGGEPGGCQL